MSEPEWVRLTRLFYSALFRSEHLIDQSDAAAEDGKDHEALRLMEQAVQETDKADELLKTINRIPHDH